MFLSNSQFKKKCLQEDPVQSASHKNLKTKQTTQQKLPGKI